MESPYLKFWKIWFLLHLQKAAQKPVVHPVVMTGDQHLMLQPMDLLTTTLICLGLVLMVTVGITVTQHRMVMSAPAQTPAAVLPTGGRQHHPSQVPQVTNFFRCRTNQIDHSYIQHIPCGQRSALCTSWSHHLAKAQILLQNLQRVKQGACVHRRLQSHNISFFTTCPHWIQGILEIHLSLYSSIQYFSFGGFLFYFGVSLIFGS